MTVGSSNVSGISLKLYPLATVRGRFVFESDPAKPNAKPPATVFANLDPVTGQARLGYPRSRPVQGATNEFEIAGVQPGEYWVRASGGGYIVKSVTLRGRDYTVTPLDTTTSEELSGLVVTMTNTVASLSGAVRLADGSTPDGAIVVVFPASASMRVNTGLSPTAFAQTTVQSDGSFTFAQLRAGEYLVAALDRSQMRTWRDPDYLRNLERQATRITLAWGQAATQTLTVVGR